MPTFTQIGSAVTVGSGGATEMNFTSIPATYTDLLVIMSARSDRAGSVLDVPYVRFNNSSTSYVDRALNGNGSAASSNVDNGDNIAIGPGTVNASNSTADVFSSLQFYVPNYLSSTYKSTSSEMVYEANTTTAYSSLAAGLWSNTSAITSVKLLLKYGNFVQHSTAYLYGVSNA
jgi:hypothetical protein